MSDFDYDLVIEILAQIQQSIRRIRKRFEPVNSPDDFTNSEAGHEKLDAICMQLIAIGESLKNLDKVTNKALLPKYTQVDWKRAKGLRDIITHHYFDLNAEAIFNVCNNQLDNLESAIKQIIEELSQ
ncbi:MAG: DUF86 domain-containing protein [Deltaproteobacteria bacterium]|nr:DUF86 domain-containing protein [Deltaproteobacteria bacterium]